MYKNGTAVKEEKVNLTGTGDEKIKTILQQRWKQTVVGSLPEEFVPDYQNKEDFRLMEIKKDGTFVWNTYGNVLLKGKWKLNKEKTVITFETEMETTFYKIDYISSYGLSLSRQF